MIKTLIHLKNLPPTSKKQPSKEESNTQEKQNQLQEEKDSWLMPSNPPIEIIPTGEP